MHSVPILERYGLIFEVSNLSIKSARFWRFQKRADCVVAVGKMHVMRVKVAHLRSSIFQSKGIPSLKVLPNASIRQR